MNPIIFNIGKFEVRWYSVLILVAFLVAYFLIKSISSLLLLFNNLVININYQHSTLQFF